MAVKPVDVIFLSWNRLEFSRFTFEKLLANTDWDLVNRLSCYDDGSEDGTREYLDKARKECPVPSSLIYLGYHSPPRTMNHHFAGTDAEYVFKCDSDCAVPPGYLQHAHEVMSANADLELLGLAAGWLGDDASAPGWEPSSHIGGIGLMRVSAFKKRRAVNFDGRFGFSAWQEQQDLVRGWIRPDCQVLQLDLLPFEPWRSLTAEYIARSWSRPWPPYSPASSRIWQWAFPGQLAEEIAA